jgi:hypothetical protein
VLFFFSFLTNFSCESISLSSFSRLGVSGIYKSTRSYETGKRISSASRRSTSTGSTRPRLKEESKEEDARGLDRPIV